MKTRTTLIVLLLLLPFFSGCDVAKQVTGAYNVINCNYDFNSISNLNLAGINVNEGLSMMNIAKATTLLSGKATSVPLNFTLNLDVTNPNQSAAFLNGLDYILSIDDIQFTTGALSQSLNVPANNKGILPLSIGFDLAGLLQGSSKDAVVGITKNFLGIGDKKSNVTLQIRPTFLVGNTSIPSPAYIPVSFAFGGKR
jgi:Conserved secreted protein